MHSIMIVDDEIHGRDLLEYIFDFNAAGFKIITKGINGLDGLNKFKEFKPDIVITDVQMPAMNGLEMIEKIKEINSEVQIIILSCYEDFNFAKKAISMGVSDYLIKDLITIESISEVLTKLKIILEKKQNINYFLNKEDELISNVFSESMFLTNILKNNKKILSDSLFEINSNLKLLLFIHIDSYDVSGDYSFEEIVTFIYEINKILKLNYGGKCFSLNNQGEFYVILGVKNSNSKIFQMESANSIVHLIRQCFFSIFSNLTITIGVSSFFSNIDEYEKYSQQAYSAKKLKLFLGNNRTIFYEMFPQGFIEINPSIFNDRLNNIKSHLFTNNSEKLINELEKIFHESLKGFMQYNYLKYVNSKLLDIIIYEINKNDIPYNYVFDCNFIPTELLNSLETVDSIYEWFSNIFRKILNFKHKKTRTFYSKHVTDAMNLINIHFTNNDIGLSFIAETLNLHKVYLCRIFKEETGQNIKDIIHNKRIEKSIELLKLGKYKLYEISDMVGYSTPQQFNIYFKKITGVSPLNYNFEK